MDVGSPFDALVAREAHEMIDLDYRRLQIRAETRRIPEDLRRYLRIEFGEADPAWFILSVDHGGHVGQPGDLPGGPRSLATTAHSPPSPAVEGRARRQERGSLTAVSDCSECPEQASF